MANDIQEFFLSIPPVTRTLVLASIVVFIATATQLVNVIYFINSWPLTVFQFEIWRPFTAFFIGLGHPMKRAMDIHVLYTYSLKLEVEKFSSSTADYVFFILFNATFIIIANIYLQGWVYMPTLMMALTYTWAQDNVNQLVTFYFLSIRSVYLPVLMLLLALLLEGTQGALQLGVGYASAHCYLFFNTLLPLSGGRRFIHTPKFLYDLIPGKPQIAISGPATDSTAARDFGTTFNSKPNQSTSSSSNTPPSSNSTSYSKSGFSSSLNRFQGKGHRLGN